MFYSRKAEGAYAHTFGLIALLKSKFLSYLVLTIFWTSALSSGVGENLSQTGFMTPTNSALLTSFNEGGAGFLGGVLEASSFFVHKSMK